MTFERPLFYDRQGKPIDVFEFGRLHSDRAYVRIAETTIGDWWVSTVWLGIDHNFGFVDEPGPRPVIFETMPFYTGKDWDSVHPELRDLDNEPVARYCTEAVAVAGHDSFCVSLRTLMANVQMADDVMAEAIAKAEQEDMQ